jgi:hypothetical protein
VFLCSCSSVEQIQRNSNTIRSLAQDSKQNFEKIYEAAIAVPVRLEEIKNRSYQGISEQTEIIAKTEGIIEATSGVVDTVPWWANMIEVSMVAIAIIGVVVLLWYTGLGTLLRKLIGFVPEAKKQEAKLLDEALSGDTSLRETIAFLRAKDPVLDTAFQRRKSAKL